MTELHEKIPFTPNSQYSLGVEIEFQILDKNTLNLAPLAPLLLQNSPKILSPRITHEFIRSILELQTGVCRTLRDVENDLMETCSMAEELAEENGCMLYAASLHPFAKSSEQILTEDVRYERIMQELQIVGRQFISQGLHVHIGMPDGDTAIRVCNHIQVYLPLLLSLSASSPFFQGEDTGLLSYRTKLFEVLPLAGIYESFLDWQHFVDEVENLKKLGIIGSIKDLWWDARPSPDFGTIELRVCDLPGRFSDILALVAFMQSLVVYIAEKKDDFQPFSNQILRANKWQAVRYGLEGFFIDPSGHLGKASLSIRRAIELLLEEMAPYSIDLHSNHYLMMIKRILECGTNAEYQKKIYKETNSFKKVIFQTHQEFWQ